MNGRGLLLLLLTLGFVGVWQQDTAWKATEPTSESDDSVEEVADREQLQRWNSFERVRSLAGQLSRAQQFVLDYDLAYAPGVGTQDHAIVSATNDDAKSADGMALVSLSDAGVPIPDGIARGEYRVVNNRGDVLRVSITDRDLADGGVDEQLPARDLYTSYESGDRWFFVRLTQDESVLVQQLAPLKSVITKVEAEPGLINVIAGMLEKGRRVQIRRRQRAVSVRRRLQQVSNDLANSLGEVETRLADWPQIWSDWTRSVVSSEAEAEPVRVSSEPTTTRTL